MTHLAAAGRITVLLVATAFVTGSPTPQRARPAPIAPEARAAPVVPFHRAPPRLRATTTTPALAVPAALTKGLDLRAAPIAVPLTLSIPSIGVNAAVIGVGITRTNVMDAPEGSADDPVWQQAFWYRGSAVPGAPSTALIAGHIDDPLGRPGTFANIARLRVGDRIVVHDNRSGLDVRFAVVGSASYPLDQTTDPTVLKRIYGTGPVRGHWPERSRDGRGHLTLVTCAGIFQPAIGTHDRRLAVYATRIA